MPHPRIAPPLCALSLALASCTSSGEPARCVAGASVACACTSGASGAQVCRDDGMGLGPCVCSSVGDSSDGVTLDAPEGTTPDRDDSGDLGEVGPSDSAEPADGDAVAAGDGATSPDARGDARDDDIAVPSAGIHIEVYWHTPGDINETDTGGDQIYFSVGSDMDLHFLHPKAYGAYFDWSYDCYWDNIQPEWGIFGPADNPHLTRDDTDGAGPETLDLLEPEAEATYQVGVHYWNDWGYGMSYATVLVYVGGVLVDRWADVPMQSDDMWDSHTIGPGPQVTRIGEAPRITPNYRGFSGGADASDATSQPDAEPDVTDTMAEADAPGADGDASP